MSFQNRIEGLVDRLNPVLIKEVRQSLRGKQFRNTFGFMVTIALLVAIFAVLFQASRSHDDSFGADFFTASFTCLSLAVVVFVPMSAFSSLGAEFEEHTIDMLVISRIKPREIMLGKWFAALVQTMLYISVFGFFLVFAFLFGGVDPILVLLSIPLLLLASGSLSALALGLSSFSRKRVVRVTLMISLVGFSFMVLWTLGSIVGALGYVGIDLASPDVHTGIAGLVSGALVLGSVPFAVGVTRLSHPEENRSSGLRILAFLIVLGLLGWETWIYRQLGEVEVVVVLSSLALFVAGSFAAFFGTERESLGRRVAAGLPANRALRWFLIPWLPGGGRGVLWFLAMAALIIGYANTFALDAAFSGLTGILHGPVRSATTVQADGMSFALKALLLIAAYQLVYFFLIAGLFPNWGQRPRRTAYGRLAIPVFFVLGIMVPMISGLIFGFEEWAGGSHYGNPLWVLGQFSEGFPLKGAWPMGVVVLAALALQLPRIVKGVSEVDRAGGSRDSA